MSNSLAIEDGKKMKVLLNFLSCLYPIAVFFLIVVFKVPIRVFALFVIILFSGYISILIVTNKQKKRLVERKTILALCILLLLVIASFISNSSVFIRLYSFFVNVGLFIGFSSSLHLPESIIYRFATLAQPTIKQSITREKVKKYCRKVTILWCVFFVINGTIAFMTALFFPEKIWAIYNGFISYILIGVLFAGEFIVRTIIQKGMEKEIPLSQLQENSRSSNTILCYEGNWSKGKYKTWNDFVLDTAKLRSFISQHPQKQWFLHCEDTWFFLVAYTALLQSQKEVLLTANTSSSFLEEIRPQNTPFLTDQALTNTSSISKILEEEKSFSPQQLIFPTIHPDDTSIILYTSGSTGRPKAVVQRLTEFEQDNKFILSQWGPEFITRKLCTTVSHHHIYGLLFSIMLPFTAGVPFRRNKIEHPEEFLALTDTSYIIITVPAFLKRANELNLTQQLTDPWIFTSGGVLTPEEAQRTSENFGAWPIEVYGSTETSGIAWRCSKTGIEWTPFDNAEITLAENGCLKVRSPYIKNPEGFVTGDLADIQADGKFILKGRADSIVKIEEKRISTTEIEFRLMQTKLIQEAVVVPVQSIHRQILGAVIVLNQAGKEMFAQRSKLEINNYFKKYLCNFFEQVVVPRKWRFIDSIPLDSQGKKSRQFILSLFEKENLFSIHHKEIQENSATIIFCVPATSPYFDGHFPNFPVLPAVAQINIGMELAKQCFGIPSTPYQIKKCKFLNILAPETEVKASLKLSQDRKTLTIKMEDTQTGEFVYSQSTIKMEKE